MKLKDGRITILIDQMVTRIELYDSDSGLTFAEIKLTPEQLSTALSRLSMTPCEITLVDNMDLVGKKLEVKTHSFVLPFNPSMPSWEKYSDEELYDLAVKSLGDNPDGWIPDKYFSSQNTFFTNSDGVKMCRVNIRRWV